MRSKEFWDWYDNDAAPKLVGPRGTLHRNVSPLHKEKIEFNLDRSATFRKMFEHLDKFDHPVWIVETGCVQDPDNWAGNGCSTILFDRYAQTHPGSRVSSVDIDPDSVDVCRSVVSNCTHVEVGDSIATIKHWVKQGGKVDLLYLDASHHDWIIELPSQVHHIRELYSALPGLRDDSMVAVDDTRVVTDDFPQNKVIGKGGLVAEHAFQVGATLEFLDYQIGFTNIAKTSFEFGSQRQGREERIVQMVKDARSHVEAGHQLQADRIYRLIIVQTAPPWTGKERIARGEALAHFARLAHAMRRYGIALEFYRRALECDPLATEYRLELATRCMVNMGALKPARREALVAAEIDPDNPQVWAALGGIYSDLLDAGDAIAAYDKQIDTSANYPEVHPDALLNRACLALDTEDYSRTRALCAEIVKTHRKADGTHVLAMLAHRESRHEEAIALFDAAIAGNCRNLPLAHWNKSQPLQALGRFKEAFAEHAWAAKEQTVPALFIPHQRFTQPQWQGEPVPATLHVHTEAGAGDNLALVRYLPLLAEYGYKVRYEAFEGIEDLVQRSMPEIEVVPRAKDYPGALGIKAFDYHIPIGDLPHAFGIDVDTILWRGPYLKADPAKVELFAKLLAKDCGRKVGFCWSSGIRLEMNIWMERYGRRKSMHFDQMAPLMQSSGVSPISLQVGPERMQIDRRNFAVRDVLPEKPSWDDTAALIANLDLVITVDTGVAHLAGALGKPVWVILQRDAASWHFMCWRPGCKWNEKSPWYPTARLFRKHGFGDAGWAPVVNDVEQALREMALIAA